MNSVIKNVMTPGKASRASLLPLILLTCMGAQAATFTGSELATKIILGGGGNWGMVPMVPNEHVPQQDALGIARWILGLPPSR